MATHGDSQLDSVFESRAVRVLEAPEAAPAATSDQFITEAGTTVVRGLAARTRPRIMLPSWTRS